MITKLLKHEAVRTRGLLAVILGGAIGVVAVAIGMIATGWPAISELGLAIGGVAVAGLVPAVHIALAIDYWRSSYRTTAYLTHSLPVRGGTIYAAKAIWASLATLVALALTIGLGLALYPVVSIRGGGDPNPFPAIGDFLAGLAAAVPAWVIPVSVLAILLFYLGWPIQLFFAASRGSEEPLNRQGAGGPVIVFVVLYFVTQAVSMLGILALPLAIGPTAEGGLDLIGIDPIAAMGASDAGFLPIGFVPAMLLITAYCLWRTARSWNRRVSLV